MSKPRSVLFLASEVTPLAKVGGLADVVGALPIALRRQGVDARILMPRYGTIKPETVAMTERFTFDVPLQAGKETVRILEGQLPSSDVPVYFLDNERFFGGERIYFDASAFVNQFVEFERFLFFSLAAVATLPHLDTTFDVLHCHDWHTGLVPLLVQRAERLGELPKRPATVFTIHNLANQGRWNAQEILGFTGLTDEDHPVLVERQAGSDLNLMAIGIKTADWVNTVSPQYAKEILTPEYGVELDPILAKRGDQLSGIVNGIDVDRFNPATDPSIPARYDIDSFARKADNKAALQKKAGLRVDPNAPLFGFVGRLTDQKGLDLLAPILDQLVEQGGQVAILGTGMDEYQKLALAAMAKHRGAVHATIGFDAAFAQLIYAGCDFFFMPSRFEPCGLGQMIAMRYGTIPIVRATGGLQDTVPNYTGEAGRGFSFDAYSSEALWEAIERALQLYRDRDAFATLAKRDMAVDFSWDASSRAYLELYTNALAQNE
jgi:starch synthase